MDGSILTHLLQLLLLLPADGSVPCQATVTPPTRQGDAWVYNLTIETGTLALAGISVVEDGTDVMLTIERDEYSASVDVAPSRYAIERVVAPLWRRGAARVVVRGFERPLEQMPRAFPVCVTWRAPQFLPLLVWQSMATAAQRSESGADPAARDAAREGALAAAAILLDPALTRMVPRDLAAGAEHERGFLLSRRARHIDAQHAFEQAQSLWRDAGRLAQAHAAEFNAAQEMLSGGRPAQALAALQPLLDDAALRATPGIINWARNDRCLALRALDRRDEAVTCFAALAPRLQAAGEIKEASNTLCNWGAALGTARRWPEAAQILQRCEASRRQIGLPAGLAHAHLLLGWAALETGETGSAITQFGSALDFAAKSGDASRIWDAQRWLAQAWVDADELPRARATLRSRQPDPEQDPARFQQWRMALGQIALIDEDLPAAAENLRAAADGLSALGLEAAAQDARCQLAQIERGLDMPKRCDELTSAEVYLERSTGQQAAEFLKTASASSEGRILRRLLRLKIDAASAPIDMQQGRAVLDAALALESADATADQVRGQLLARIGFEFARLAHDRDDAGMARLALDALLAGRQASSVLSVDLVQRRSVSFRAGRSSVANRIAARPGEIVVATTSLLGTTFLVVDAGPETLHVIGIPTVELRDAVEKWRYAVATDQDVGLATLSLTRVLQVRDWWRPHTERLVVAAHGALADIAWGALAIDGAPVARLGFRPLVADAVVVQLAGKPEPPRPPAPTQRLGIFAETSADELPGVADEIAAIEAGARKADWRIERIGENRSFDGRQLDVFHVAGHAVTDRIDEARNTLRAGDDAVRWPAEWIAHSALVVLAGCDTAQGPRSRWQAAGSLARRALDGGASLVLAHIWPIPDRPAARLHASFYRHLFDGESAEVALVHAQRERLDSREDSIVRNWASAVILSRDPQFKPSLPLAQR